MSSVFISVLLSLTILNVTGIMAKLVYFFDDFLRSQLIITTSLKIKNKLKRMLQWFPFIYPVDDGHFSKQEVHSWIHVTTQYCACIIITQGAVCSQSPGSCADSTCILGTHKCHNLYKLAAHRHWSDKALKCPKEYLDPSGFWALLGRFAVLHKQDSV